MLDKGFPTGNSISVSSYSPSLHMKKENVILSSMKACFFLWVTLAISAWGVVMDTKNQQSSLAFPRGVAEPAGTSGYMTNASDGISAVDLVTGKVLWSTSEAARPLLVVGNRLAALRLLKANALQVVILDVTRNGTAAVVSEPIVFPDWVRVGVQNNEDFAVHARSHTDALLLDWEAHAFYRGGAAPSPKVLQQSTKHAAGTAQINLDTGRVTMLPLHGNRQPLSTAPQFSVRPTPEPGAREVCAVGPRVYYLVDELVGKRERRTVLKAREAESGELLWELPLEAQQVSKPRPLRP